MMSSTAHILFITCQYNNASIWPFLCHHFLSPLIQNLPKPMMFYVSCVELELIPQNEFHFAVLLVV
ncbi:unnamed protein product [Brassica rapa subsp. narinosa]